MKRAKLNVDPLREDEGNKKRALWSHLQKKIDHGLFSEQSFPRFSVTPNSIASSALHIPSMHQR
jgi:hypothetical protein